MHRPLIVYHKKIYRILFGCYILLMIGSLIKMILNGTKCLIFQNMTMAMMCRTSMPVPVLIVVSLD